MVEIKTMEESRNSPITNYTKNGKCSQCQSCCSNILPLTKLEVLRIKNYVDKYKIKEFKILVPTAEYHVDMTCPFANQDKNICTIYEIRPRICRDFMCNKPPPKNIKLEDYNVTFIREKFYGGNYEI